MLVGRLRSRKDNNIIAADVVDGKLVLRRYDGSRLSVDLGGGSLVGISPSVIIIGKGTVPGSSLADTQVLGSQLPLDIITPSLKPVIVFDTSNEERLVEIAPEDLVGTSGDIHTHGYHILWNTTEGPTPGQFWVEFDEPGVYALRSQAYFQSEDVDGIRGFHISYNSATQDINSRYVIEDASGISQDVVKGSGEIFVVNTQDAFSGDDTSALSASVFHTAINPILSSLYLSIQRVL